MKMDDIRPLILQNLRERLRRQLIAGPIQLPKIVDALGNRKSPDLQTAILVALQPRAGRDDHRFEAISQLLPCQRFDVHLGAADRIGMVRKRDVKDLQRLSAR